MNPTKGTQGFSTENQKLIWRENKEYLNIACLQLGRNNIVRVSIFSKLIYRVCAISILKP